MDGPPHLAKLAAFLRSRQFYAEPIGDNVVVAVPEAGIELAIQAAGTSWSIGIAS